MYFMKKRRLTEQIKQHIGHKNAIVLIGARQVGKTTLLRDIFKDLPVGQKLWFDLDNPLHQKIFEDIDYDDIYKELVQQGLDPEKRQFVFIDEIQNFPEITKVIKYLLDHYQVKFFLTGSSSFYTKNLFPESLAGRKLEFELHPLDFGEFLYFKDLVPEIPELRLNFETVSLASYERFDKELEEFVNYGSFPAVVLEKNFQTKKMILDDIFKSFFQIDILQMSQYKDVQELRDLILLLTRRVGSKLDVTKLASELGTQRHKIYSYLEFLESIFVITLLSQFSKSPDKSVAAGKKIYFLDTGLLNHIAQVGEGELFENTTFNVLKNHGKLNYYQNRSAEIDFILDSKVAFEVKLTGTHSYYKKLRRLADSLELEEAYLISKSFVKDTVPVMYLNT